MLGNMCSDSEKKLCRVFNLQLFDRICNLLQEDELDLIMKSLFMHILQNVIKAKPLVFTYLQVIDEKFLII